MHLQVQTSVWNDMQTYGKASPHHEVVGAMLGHHVDDEISECNEFIPMTNIADQNGEKRLVGSYFNNNLPLETHYIPDPNEFFQVLKRTRLFTKKSKIELVGIFHTHPHHASRPSITDIHGAGYAGFYPIMSLTENKTNVFYYDGEHRIFEPVTLTLTGNKNE